MNFKDQSYPTSNPMERLFSYGTLQDESVQLATFNRKLQGAPDVLKGWVLEDLVISDPHVIEVSGKNIHQVLMATGNRADEVVGTVFKLAPQEIEQADSYEVSDYKRVKVQLNSGTQAWVYVHQSTVV